MDYLSCSKTVLENFTLLANNTGIVTEEYDRISKEISDEEFPAKVRALKITALAIAALGILVAIKVSFIPGLLLGCVAVFPGIGMKYQLDRENGLIKKLDQAAYDVDLIFDKIAGYLKCLQSKKEDTLIERFTWNDKGQELSHAEAIKNLATYSERYDTNFYGKADEHIKLFPLVDSIISRKAPPSIPSDKWKKLRNACFLFRYGQASNIQNAWIINEDSYKTLPYVKLTELKDHTWTAEKY